VAIERKNTIQTPQNSNVGIYLSVCNSEHDTDVIEYATMQWFRYSYIRTFWSWWL